MTRSRFGIVLLLLVAAAWGWARNEPPPVYRNTGPEVAYVGSKSCAAQECHAALTANFRSTPMGNSMAPATIPSSLARAPQLIMIHNRDLDRTFEVFSEGSDLYQSEYAVDQNGKTVFKETERLEYVIGGPLTGFTYVIRRGQHLFEAPLSYYDKTQAWDMSPGYIGVDVGFTRPITDDWLSCHNGQPVGVPNRDGMYQDPPFRFGECAISCEACHGPGSSLHLQELAEKSGRHSHKPDTSIVNPARLSPRLADDICMNCHQGGHTRILQPGKDYMDFRPGTPLYQTVALFKIPLKPEQREEANRLETLPPVRGSLAIPLWWKNSSLQLSKCFEASHGQLRCITCHVIHNPPVAANKAEYYRERCFTCHNNKSCKLSVQERMQHEPANDCIGCHMSKMPVAGIPHSDDTNHRIVRRAGQPLPEIAFSQSPPDLPGLVCINKRAGESDGPLPLLTKVRAYGDVIGKEPALGKYYQQGLEQLSKEQPQDPLVLGALGQKALAAGDNAHAVDYLSRALTTGGDFPLTFVYLGEALVRTGHAKEATQILEQGAAAWPYAPVIQKELILTYINQKDYPRAHELMKQYVALFPGDTFMHGLLRQVEGSTP